MKVGYIRVSTQEQNTIRQEVLMKEMNVEKVYIDKVSGKNTDRTALKEMLAYVREGDVVMVESISRFARNTKDLLELIEILHSKDVRFVSNKEAIDTSTPTGRFMITIFGAVAELEREYILQRQREGIAIAKANGVYSRKKKKEIQGFNSVYKDWKEGNISAVQAMKKLNISKSTFYRRVNEYEREQVEI